MIWWTKFLLANKLHISWVWGHLKKNSEVWSNVKLDSTRRVFKLELSLYNTGSCYRNYFKFQYEILFEILWLHAYTKKNSQAKLQVGRPKFHHNSNLDLLFRLVNWATIRTPQTCSCWWLLYKLGISWYADVPADFNYSVCINY